VQYIIVYVRALDGRATSEAATLMDVCTAGESTGNPLESGQTSAIGIGLHAHKQRRMIFLPINSAGYELFELASGQTLLADAKFEPRHA
jgi:hypothetical protein